MKKIRRLSENSINQIAAGEVVENPASVIKELIENSLDANASHIVIRIEKGGQELIEIEDDGDGMGPEDAVISLERHATSKIQSADDLNQLSTLGFRGEALAAITSVSQFEIKTFDGTEGTHIIGAGGIVEEVIPVARNRGTTIAIRSLFYNTPARKKFQKSIASNTAQVSKVVEILSMANPEVAFTYISQGETIYSLEKESRKERVERLLGPFEYFSEQGKFWGLFGAPALAKTQRRSQFLFINKRPVFSPLISKAVQTAYGMRLENNRYPAFTLFLELEPHHFDINVHPQKKEIRFSKESALFSQVEAFVSKVFSPKSLEERKPIFFDPIPNFVLSDFPKVKKEERQSPFAFELKAVPLTVFDRFFLYEKEGLFVMDLQKASARIFFEEVGEKKGQSQSLLIPLEIEEDPDLIPSLEKMGFECRQISHKKVAIDALPSRVDPEDLEIFISSWKEGKKLEDLSCRYFLRAKKRYALDEALHIFEILQKCTDSDFDPLGNRIWKKVLPSDLESLIESF